MWFLPWFKDDYYSVYHRRLHESKANQLLSKPKKAVTVLVTSLASLKLLKVLVNNSKPVASSRSLLLYRVSQNELWKFLNQSIVTKVETFN